MNANRDINRLLLNYVDDGKWKLFQDIARSIIPKADYKKNYRNVSRRACKLVEAGVLERRKVGKTVEYRLATVQPLTGHNWMQDPSTLWRPASGQEGIFSKLSPIRAWPSGEYSHNPPDVSLCWWACVYEGAPDDRNLNESHPLDSLTDFQVLSEARNALAYKCGLGAQRPALADAVAVAGRNAFPTAGSMPRIRAALVSCREFYPRFLCHWDFDHLVNEETERIDTPTWKFRPFYGPGTILTTLMSMAPEKIGQLRGETADVIWQRYHQTLQAGGGSPWTIIRKN